MTQDMTRKMMMIKKTLLMVLMMTFGINGSWADGYEGTWYIGVYGSGTKSQCASENPAENFYLCPTEGWCYYNGVSNDKGQITNENNGQPFLTSFKCRNGVYDATKAVWTIEKAPAPNSSYYYIKQTCTGKYLVFNKQLDGAGENRVRVHLETITPPAVPDEYALFEISTVSTTDDRNGYCVFHPKKAASGYYLNISDGNVNSVSTPGNGKTDGPTDYENAYINVSGIVGQWNQANNTSSYKLEPYSPFITFNASNKVEIKATPSNATLVYTTDESDPTASPLNGTAVNTNTVSFAPDDDVTTIKAIAIVNGVESAVATFTPPTLLGTDHKRLIQSQNNAWNTTDFHFYMIPGDDVGEDPNKITKVNTTSLFRPTMEWHLLYAGKDDLAGGYLNQYYYIVNSNGKYLCYDGTNKVYMAGYTDDNKFKFKIEKSGSAGSFNIIPYDLRNESGNTARFIYKANGNNSSDAIDIIKTDNGTSRWKFVLSSTLDKTAPFIASEPASDSYSYYKIASVGSSGHYIIPGSPNAITSNNTTDANVVKSGIWYFEVALAATNEDWCTYYHIRNAETGEYLYFTKDANGNEPCLATSNTITEGSENRYMFTWARTATENAYYIVPKILKDVSLNQISSLRKQDNKTGIFSNTTRGASNFAWNFSNVLFCKDPIFEEKEIGGVNKIEISCVTTGSEIHYTLDGSDPSDPANNPQTYSEAITSPTGNVQMVIRAIAVVSDANLTPSTASSEISTLLYNPTITLDPAYNYGYDGTAKTPAATVSVGEVTAPTTAYTIGYSGDNVNVGTNTATATIQDVTDDNWYIWGNLSVTFSITLPTINITVSIDDWTYGGTASTPSVSGNPDGTDDQIIYEYKVKDAGNNTYSSTVPTNAGDYVVKATLPGSTNYGESVATKDFVINKATLTVTGSDSKHYGADDPASIAYTTEGLASWDTASEILTGSLIRAAGENTGTYAITQGTLALSENAKAANYTLVFAGGTFRIIGTSITVVLSLDGWTYGDDVNVPSIEVTDPTDYPINTATVKYYYKKKNEAVSKYTETVPINAGTYNVKVVINPNVSYEGAEVVKEFTIGRAAITITADDKVKGYGDNDPELTYTVSGLKYSDTEQVVLSCELQRTPGEDMGNYTITKTTPDNSIIQSGNYSLSSFTEATLTITAKNLGNSVTLEPAQGIRIYAIKNGEDSWTISVYNNETVFTENTDYTFEVTGPDNGNYTIVVNAVENSKCTGSAKATYLDLPFNVISSTEKVAPYITTVTDQVTATVGVRPYIVSKVNPSLGTITVVPVSYIPKDVPVLLLADNDATGLTIIPKNDDTNDISENTLNTNKLMYASQNKEVAAAETYIYYKGEFVLALAGTITPGHFYLYNPNYVAPTPNPDPNEAPARMLNIIKDETTGLSRLSNDNSTDDINDRWYTLDGRRLSGKPTKKGLYINNGSKVVIK